MRIHRSTIQLLRFPFSVFLAPVFLFALSEVTRPVWTDASLAFLILHGLVYPASNGYNSWMDRDETPIGGLSAPPQPTPQLLLACNLLDGLAVALSLVVSATFALGVGAYILASRAYSHRSVRIKRVALPSLLTVVVCQGLLTFALSWHACSGLPVTNTPPLPMAVAGLLIAGAYPLTQIYQHEADRLDGVRSFSMLLGIKGTFLFSAIVYSAAFALLGIHYGESGRWTSWTFFLVAMMPVLLFFTRWALSAWRDEQAADHANAMRMNTVASVCSSLAFLTLAVTRTIG
jgi:1,4-dihydroxy-2-naphthoate octaprenyltransferase